MRKRTAAVVALIGVVMASTTCAGRGDVDLITIIAPAAPGGGWDQTARAMQAALEDVTPRPIRVVNVAGAGGTIGLAQMVDANRGQPNVLLVTGLIMVGATLTNDSPVTLGDTTPLARLTGDYEVLVVPAASPYGDLATFLDAWRADPGALPIAGGSAGGTDHMLVGLLARATGVSPSRINYVPHSGGGESMASILGGQVTAGVNGLSELVPFIEAGRLRPLAISSAARVPGREIPTFVEQGVDLTLTNWRGVVGPPDLSEAQRTELASLVDAMRQTQAWQDALARNDWIDLYLGEPDFEAFLASEHLRAAGVLASIGLGR